MRPNSFSPPPQGSQFPPSPSWWHFVSPRSPNLASVGRFSQLHPAMGALGGGGLGGVLGGTGRHWELLEQEGRVAGAQLNPLNPPLPWLPPRPAAKPPANWLLSRWSKWKQVKKKGGGGGEGGFSQGP